MNAKLDNEDAGKDREKVRCSSEQAPATVMNLRKKGWEENI